MRDYVDILPGVMITPDGLAGLRSIEVILDDPGVGTRKRRIFWNPATQMLSTLDEHGAPRAIIYRGHIICRLPGGHLEEVAVGEASSGIRL